MQIVETVITFILVSSILILLFKNIRLRFRNNDLIASLLQSQIDKVILKDHIDKDRTTNEEKDSSNDGFLKFISDSREHAFKYIEESQKTIESFVKFLDNNIEYLKSNQPKDLKYKTVMKSLETYLVKLKNLLPKGE